MYFEEMDLAHKINQINKTITLVRNVEIKHQHGGSSRINPKTSAITKSEVMISRHVYIQKFYSGINLILLHISMLIISLSSQLIMALVSLPFAWTNKGRTSLLLLSTSIQYYWYALINKSWKSRRLKGS
jgi:GT2 family glycosyltransferase